MLSLYNDQCSWTIGIWLSSAATNVPDHRQFVIVHGSTAPHVLLIVHCSVLTYNSARCEA